MSLSTLPRTSARSRSSACARSASSSSTVSCVPLACPRARSAECTTSCGAALNWAERLDLIVWNPAAKVERPRGAKPDINPRAPADVVRMITEASKPLALFLRLGALTGARRGQLCGLRWSDEVHKILIAKNVLNRYRVREQGWDFGN